MTLPACTITLAPRRERLYTTTPGWIRLSSPTWTSSPRTTPGIRAARSATRQRRPVTTNGPMKTSRLGRDVFIGPFVVTGRRCRVADRAALMPGVVLGDDVHVGEDSLIHPGVVVYSRSRLGARVIVHAGSVIGSDGFGYAEQGGARAKIPQVGNVVVEDDVEIGACVTIDRGTFGSTV